METNNLLQNLLLGGLLGLLGQGIRVFAGLKKLSESKKVNNQDSFDIRRLAVSLLLGFIAGALGSLTLLDEMNIPIDNHKKPDFIFKLIGIGYAGVDFLEAFLTKYVPTTTGLSAGADKIEQTEQTTQNKAQPTAGTTLVPTLPYSSK